VRRISSLTPWLIGAAIRACTNPYAAISSQIVRTVGSRIASPRTKNCRKLLANVTGGCPSMDPLIDIFQARLPNIIDCWPGRQATRARRFREGGLRHVVAEQLLFSHAEQHVAVLDVLGRDLPGRVLHRLVVEADAAALDQPPRLAVARRQAGL